MGDPSPLFGLSNGGVALRGSRPRSNGASGVAGQDFFWMALAGAAAGFVLLVFRPNRDRIRDAEAECRLLRAEIASLESRVAHLRGWERSLAAGDPEAWTAVARERLGWTRPGERMIGPAARRRGRPRELARAAFGVRAEIFSRTITD